LWKGTSGQRRREPRDRRSLFSYCAYATRPSMQLPHQSCPDSYSSAQRAIADSHCSPHANDSIAAFHSALQQAACTNYSDCRGRLLGFAHLIHGIRARGRKVGGGETGFGMRAGRRCGCRIRVGGRIRRIRSRWCSLGRARCRKRVRGGGLFRCRGGKGYIGVGRMRL
jgi:hypothetical protein